MSELADQLMQVNTDIRAAIASERTEVKAKLDELLAKIEELKSDDPAIAAAIEDTKKIVGEINSIFEAAPPITTEPPVTEPPSEPPAEPLAEPTP